MRINFVLADAALNRDGSRLVAGGADGRVRLWDAHTGTLLAEQRTPDGEGIMSVAFSPDGSRVALGGENGSVRLWDGNSTSPLSASLGHHGDWVLALTFSPDGTLLASGANEGTVRIWNVATQQPSGAFDFDDAITGDGTSVVALAFDRSGTTVAAGGSRTVRLWDITRKALSGDALQTNSGVVTSLAFSPTGQELVSGNDAGVMQIWDVGSRQLAVDRRVDSSGIVVTLVFNDDGSRLAAGMSSGGVLVWDPEKWALLGQLELDFGSIETMAFSPDDTSLAALGATGVVSQWNLSPAAWRQRACSIAGRTDRQEWGQYIGDPDDPTLPYRAVCPDLPLPSGDDAATPVGSDTAGTVPLSSIEAT